MLESIITDYLHQHRRLVIPDLGAFLKKEGGEVVFAPFLNKNDGILTGLVRQNYGASSTEAEGIITKYVDNVLETVDTKGAYLLSPLGWLKKDPNGLLFLDVAGVSTQSTAQETTIREVIVPQPEETIILEPEAVVIPEPEIESPIRIELEVSSQPEPVSLGGGPEPELPKKVHFSEPSEPHIVAETVDGPRTLNDLIRERQEQQEPPKTIHDRMSESAEVSKPVKKPARPASAPQQKTTASGAQKEKRGDIILIAAVVVAVVAVVAMIYAYAVVDLPLFNLQ